MHEIILSINCYRTVSLILNLVYWQYLLTKFSWQRLRIFFHLAPQCFHSTPRWHHHHLTQKSWLPLCALPSQHHLNQVWVPSTFLSSIDRNCDVLPLSLDDFLKYTTLMLTFCTNKPIGALPFHYPQGYEQVRRCGTKKPGPWTGPQVSTCKKNIHIANILLHILS